MKAWRHFLHGAGEPFYVGWDEIRKLPQVRAKEAALYFPMRFAKCGTPARGYTKIVLRKAGLIAGGLANTEAIDIVLTLGNFTVYIWTKTDGGRGSCKGECIREFMTTRKLNEIEARFDFHTGKTFMLPICYGLGGMGTGFLPEFQDDWFIELQGPSCKKAEYFPISIKQDDKTIKHCIPCICGGDPCEQ